MAIGIPVAFCATFLVMLITGQTINMISVVLARIVCCEQVQGMNTKNVEKVEKLKAYLLERYIRSYSCKRKLRLRISKNARKSISCKFPNIGLNDYHQIYEDLADLLKIIEGEYIINDIYNNIFL